MAYPIMTRLFSRNRKGHGKRASWAFVEEIKGDQALVSCIGHLSDWFVTRTDSTSASNGVALCDAHLAAWLRENYDRDQAALDAGLPDSALLLPVPRRQGRRA